MMFNKIQKQMIRPSDCDTDFFDSVTGVLQRRTFASFLSIIGLNYIWRTSIDLTK